MPPAPLPKGGEAENESGSCAPLPLGGEGPGEGVRIREYNGYYVTKK